MGTEALLEKARQLSWQGFGKQITFYLPGMFTCNNCRGRYPALSITGDRCELMCKHCRGELLKTMIAADTPERLLETCIEADGKGHYGVLISGGCDRSGQLPWGRFIPVIGDIKRQTGLRISIHSGFIDRDLAAGLKTAGVDQALIDVIGDDETLREIYHLDHGVGLIRESLDALAKAGIETVPHIVCGLHYGEMRGEEEAARLISDYDVPSIAIVSLMKLPAIAGWVNCLPNAEAVSRAIAQTRLANPKAEISLGCARTRGDDRLEIMAIDAGINRMALPSEAAVEHAEEYGLDIRYLKTCCSVADIGGEAGWL